jgi:hypothetical protein
MANTTFSNPEEEGMEQSGAAVYAKVVTRAWRDAAFKEHLLADPASALAGMGVAVPAGKTVKMVENNDQVINLVLLAPPAETGLSDEALERAALQAQNFINLGPTTNINE